MPVPAIKLSYNSDSGHVVIQRESASADSYVSLPRHAQEPLVPQEKMCSSLGIRLQPTDGES